MLKSNSDIIKYYKFHSKIYDFTRPFFLFGRKELSRLISRYNVSKVAEIGCGTGSVLKRINHLDIYAFDFSQEMLEKAKSKISKKHIKLIQKDFFDIDEKFDLLIFSYSITMMANNIQEIIKTSQKLLNNNGRIFVLDFHKTNNFLYKKYMNVHSIDLSGNLLDSLENNYGKEHLSIKKAYFGIWEYFIFIGQKID